VKAQQGFTLLELLVVLSIVVLTFAFLLPSFPETIISSPLKKECSRLAAFIAQTRNLAMRQSSDHILHLDLDNNTYFLTSEDGNSTHPLPQQVRFRDVIIHNGDTVSHGIVDIFLSHKGYAAPALIHLTDNEDLFTLVLSPFLADTTIVTGYQKVWHE